MPRPRNRRPPRHQPRQAPSPPPEALDEAERLYRHLEAEEALERQHAVVAMEARLWRGLVETAQALRQHRSGL
jgi:hypothetical protein